MPVVLAIVDRDKVEELLQIQEAEMDEERKRRISQEREIVMIVCHQSDRCC